MKASHSEHTGKSLIDVEFDCNDSAVLETTVRLVPELTIVAFALKHFHAANINYPVTEPDQLLTLLPADQIVVHGHEITKQNIVRYLSGELFPVCNDHEFARAVYIGLNRCKAAMSWAAQAPPNAEEVMQRFRRNQKTVEAAASEGQEHESPNLEEEVE